MERFIWFGEECESNGRCTSNAYITDDAGATFNKLMANVRTCDYVGAVLESGDHELIYCSGQNSLDNNNNNKNKNKLALFSLKESSLEEPKKIFENIVGYAITGTYVVVATIDDKTDSLLSKVTVDGDIFADADFPHDLKVEPHQISNMVNFLNLILMVLILFLLLIMSIEILSGTLILIKLMDWKELLLPMLLPMLKLMKVLKIYKH